MEGFRVPHARLRAVQSVVHKVRRGTADPKLSRGLHLADAEAVTAAEIRAYDSRALRKYCSRLL